MRLRRERVYPLWENGGFDSVDDTDGKHVGWKSTGPSYRQSKAPADSLTRIRAAEVAVTRHAILGSLEPVWGAWIG